jgi:hypothetical protein
MNSKRLEEINRVLRDGPMDQSRSLKSPFHLKSYKSMGPYALHHLFFKSHGGIVGISIFNLVHRLCQEVLQCNRLILN